MFGFLGKVEVGQEISRLEENIIIIKLFTGQVRYLDRRLDSETYDRVFDSSPLLPYSKEVPSQYLLSIITKKGKVYQWEVQTIMPWAGNEVSCEDY